MIVVCCLMGVVCCVCLFIGDCCLFVMLDVCSLLFAVRCWVLCVALRL